MATAGPETNTPSHPLSHPHLHSISMSGDASPVGRCPQCGREIPEAYLLIEYETEAGETGRWAECPECNEVIDPNSIE